ncbi:transposase [Methyloglobulus sp.]|uniref:transposase n=1 Tax=Methyloglobulus sp. TaxID=2518622 RepID=UPI0039894E1A
MKTKKEPSPQVVRNKYNARFKGQALGRADRDGIPKVAQDLGLAESMLYPWRTKRRQTSQPFEGQRLQQAELARPKRENTRLEDSYLTVAGQTSPGGGIVLSGVNKPSGVLVNINSLTGKPLV